jgi:hypothetical protein
MGKNGKSVGGSREDHANMSLESPIAGAQVPDPKTVKVANTPSLSLSPPPTRSSQLFDAGGKGARGGVDGWEWGGKDGDRKAYPRLR